MCNKKAFLGISISLMLFFSVTVLDVAGQEIGTSGKKAHFSEASIGLNHPNTTERVSKVVDGDTIELSNKQRVRLLGINAPEKGKPYNKEARKRLKQLIEGKEVVLERDVEDKDRYNRLLRYVYARDAFVNLQLVKEGYATVYIVGKNTKHENEFRKAWKECIKEKQNLCKPSDSSCNNECLRVAALKYDAKGNDCINLNDEYADFNNNCPYGCDLTGWIVKDEGNHGYKFPRFILDPGKTVRLHTGYGTNTATKLYWKSSGNACNAIWNNDKDTLYLRDLNGKLILTYSYPKR